MNAEEKFKEIVERMKSEMRDVAESALEEVHTEMMPHMETDTCANVYFQTCRAVEAILSGQFKREGDYIKTSTIDSISVRLKLTDHQYDRLRKSLLEVMPECPKDLEIASLKQQLQDERNARWGLSA